jgi:phosphopantothenoylcysteine decarboxylase/phosphopantothenate--cysteine ligase
MAPPFRPKRPSRPNCKFIAFPQRQSMNKVRTYGGVCPEPGKALREHALKKGWPRVAEKRILLIVGGGVAAYKALELTRLLRKAGVAVRPILTAAGAQFVTPLSLAALAEDRVYDQLFSLTDEAEMGHIQLSRSADLIVVAPATADLIARAAAGLASDLATTTLLATDKPVLMAPAMNVRMWTHPATRRNVATLIGDGVALVGPDEGAMACGEFGPGRLAEPAVIFEAIMAALAGAAGRPLAGRHVLVTAGPTAEPIDPVRVLTNRSSGKQGYAIAGALARLGARVTLVSGPTALAPPPGVRRVDVETAQEMLAAAKAALPADAAVCVAAVADWRPDAVFGVKLKKGKEGPPTLRLVENPDILAALAASGPERPRLVVGFAAETSDVEAHARAKLARKGCDWIVANNVTEDGVMGGDDNAVMIVDAQSIDHWPRASKVEIAARIAARIAKAFA